MKAVQDMSEVELRRAAFEAIQEALGPEGLARFLRVFGGSTPDYVEARKELLAEFDSVDKLSAALFKWEAERGGDSTPPPRDLGAA